MSLAAFLFAAGVAWACSPQARFTIDPKRAPGGSEVQLEGSAFQTDTPVAFLWGTRNGPQLGVFNSDAKGQISATVSIPDVAPGVYFVLSSAGPDFEIARSSFEVVSREDSVENATSRQMRNTLRSDLWAGTKTAGGGLAGTTLSMSAEEEGIRRSTAFGMLGAGLSMVGIAAVALAAVAGETARRGRRRIR